MDDFLYQQIYRKIVSEIQEGFLKANTKLPSIRKYADENGLSCNTVQNAYNQLLAEGYIYSKEKSGYYVSEFEAGLIHEKRSFADEKTVAAVEKTAVHDDVINLSANLIDNSLFPYSTLTHLYREVLSGKNSGFLRQIGDLCGDFEFRKAISDYLYKHRDINCSPEQVVVGSGTALLLMQLTKLFTDDEGNLPVFVMETPCYTKTQQLIVDAGCKTVSIPLDKEGIDLNEIKNSGVGDGKGNCVVHVSPSHQFPTGNTMSAPRKASLLKWCYEGEGRYIVEDDYDSDFRYKGRPIPALASMDSKDRIIYMGTFSRTLTPSMRIGYMVLPVELARRYKQLFSYWTCSVSRIEQQVLSVFLNEGYFERHINRAKKICRARRDKLLELLEGAFPGVEVLGAEAGLHFIVKAKSLGFEKEEELIKKAGAVKLQLQGTGTGWIILGYAHLDYSEMERAVEILRAI